MDLFQDSILQNFVGPRVRKFVRVQAYQNNFAANQNALKISLGIPAGVFSPWSILAVEGGRELHQPLLYSKV